MFLNSIFFSTQIFSFKHIYHTKETQKNFTSNTVDCCLRNMDVAYKRNNFNFFVLISTFFVFKTRAKNFNFFTRNVYSLSIKVKYTQQQHYSQKILQMIFSQFFSFAPQTRRQPVSSTKI